jgi:hypothetical protein
MEEAMSILSTLSRIAHEYHDARTRYITERQINALPAELRKDIGWPDAYERRHSRPVAAGLWMGDK